MADGKFCLDQVRRMGRLKDFPTDAVERTELVIALCESCVDDDHAKRVIDEVMREFIDRCPVPGELRRIANSDPDERPPIGCGECVEGWIHVERRGVSCVDKCKCRKGVA